MTLLTFPIVDFEQVNVSWIVGEFLVIIYTVSVVTSYLTHFTPVFSFYPAPVVLYKKGVCKNLAKFTGKHPCQNLFFNNVAGQS